MPPWARQPTTSYWPPSMVPGVSLGSKSNGVRHFGQNPFERPGTPSRERPTCALHTEQNRLSSPTTGGSMSAWRGSSTGTDGISVRPAPRRDVWLRAPSRRVGRLPPATVRADPSGTWPSRLLAELARPDIAVDTGLDAGSAVPPALVAGAPAAAGDSAAMPHTSQ